MRNLRSHLASRALQLTVACACLCPDGAAADATHALVAVGEPAGASAFVPTARALDRRIGGLLAPQVVAERLAAHGYAAPAAPATAPETLVPQADELLRAVAFGYDDEVVVRGDLLLDGYRRELRTIGDSDRAARAVGDVCLFVVRALVHRGDLERARARALGCAQLIPGLDASPELHPPAVKALLDGARAQHPAGRIALQHEPLGPGCLLRVQGRPRAPTPEIELAPGTYAVRIDCARRGLEHRVEVRSGERLALAIDVPFEQGLELASYGVRLATASIDRLERVARWLGVSSLWTIEARAAGAQRIVRYRVSEGYAGLEPVAERSIAALPAGTHGARLDAALEALACAPRCTDGAPASAGPSALTITTASVGGAAVLASWVLFARYAMLDGELEGGDPRDAEYRSAHEERALVRDLAWLGSTAGSVAVAASAPGLLPSARGVPWWAWATGAAGVVVASAGSVLWLDHGSLSEVECRAAERCLQRSSRVPLGPMLVAQGAMLISVPVTYAMRGLLAEDDALALRAAPERIEVSYDLRF